MAGKGVTTTRALELASVPSPTRRASSSETTVVGHRRGGGTRVGLFRSVRTQLLAPIVVAMAGLAVLGTVQTATATDAARDASRAQVLATTATRTVLLVHELEREFAETVALRQRGGQAGQQLMTAQRQRTDAAANRYREQSKAARRAAPRLSDELQNTDEVLDELAGARQEALTGSPVGLRADPVYRRVANSLLAVADSLPAQVNDPDLANAARAVAALASIEHFDALERDLVRAIYVRGSLQNGDLVNLANVVGAREQRQSEFLRVAPPEARETFTTVVRGTDVEAAAKMSVAVRNGDRDPSGLKGDPDAWYVAQSHLIRRVNLVSLQVSDRLDQLASEVAADANRRAWLTALGTAGIAIAALLTAILLAVRTSRRLRRLRAAALTVARRELPDAINTVSTGRPAGDSGPSAAAATRAIAATNDEIGQVADAFGTVHRTALRLAAEQAELRVDVARMAEVLARRIRTLITRQLRLLDEFERDETDPDVLARLFALDHIAARLRRNGENLLVLAGGEPGRPMTGAFPLRAVVTAAASEIEEYQRVEATIGTELAIAAPAVGDFVHLLAELLENAASFSPPDSPVQVDARRTVDGAVVRVHDSGIGITASRLGEINGRLARPTALTSAAAGTMGLYVVAHLAARHGIRVQLHPTGNGTVAYVALPHSVLAPQSAIHSGPRPANESSSIIGAMVPAGTPNQMAAGVSTRLDHMTRNGQPMAPANRGLGSTMSPAAATGANVGAPATDGWFRPSVRGEGTGGNPPPPPVMNGFGFVPAQRTQDMPRVDVAEGHLPRRSPGSQLAPGQVAEPAAPTGPQQPATPGPTVDPEMIRARLSAFAEGVSAAAIRRGSNGSTPATTPAARER